MSDLIDIRPLIKRKRQSQCSHDHARVADSEASLTCDACEAELDPWWYLRQLANASERWDAEHEARRQHWDALEAEGVARITKLNEQITRLNEEVGRLVETKNRIMNERHNGERIEDITRRTRRRAVKP